MNKPRVKNKGTVLIVYDTYYLREKGYHFRLLSAG